MSPSSGIGVADPVNVRSFKNFFVDFNLPASVVRGEQVQVPVTAYNYLNLCTRVRCCFDNRFIYIYIYISLFKDAKTQRTRVFVSLNKLIHIYI